MGYETVVYGYIKGDTLKPGTPEYYALHSLNRAVIDGLPDDDDWPFLTRSMFSYPGEDAMHGRYRRQIIHFGASFKELESDWEEWLEKFEALLKRLYWWEAKLHLEAELVGNYAYTWKAKYDPDKWSQPIHLPTTNWDFEGGPRDFSIV